MWASPRHTLLKIHSNACIRGRAAPGSANAAVVTDQALRIPLAVWFVRTQSAWPSIFYSFLSDQILLLKKTV